MSEAEKHLTDEFAKAWVSFVFSKEEDAPIHAKLLRIARKAVSMARKEEQKLIAIGIGLPFQYVREVTEDILTCQKLRSKEIDLDMALQMLKIKQINFINADAVRVRLETAEKIFGEIERNSILDASKSINYRQIRYEKLKQSFSASSKKNAKGDGE